MFSFNTIFSTSLSVLLMTLLAGAAPASNLPVARSAMLMARDNFTIPDGLILPQCVSDCGLLQASISNIPNTDFRDACTPNVATQASTCIACEGAADSDILAQLNGFFSNFASECSDAGFPLPAVFSGTSDTGGSNGTESSAPSALPSTTPPSAPVASAPTTPPSATQSGPTKSTLPNAAAASAAKTSPSATSTHNSGAGRLVLDGRLATFLGVLATVFAVLI